MSTVIEQGATRWVTPADYLPAPSRTYVPQKVDIKGPSVTDRPNADPRYPRDKKSKFSRNTGKRTIGSDARDARIAFRNVARKNREALKRGFGTGLRDRAFPPLPGRLPIWHRFLRFPLLDTMSWVDEWVGPNEATWPDNFVPSGWVVQHACVPPGRPNAFRTQQNCGTSVNCLGGQSGNGRSLPVYISAGEKRFTLITNTTTGTGFLRYQNNKWFIRSPCTVQTGPIYTGIDHVVHAQHPARNPNFHRRMPSVRPHNPLAAPRFRVPRLPRTRVRSDPKTRLRTETETQPGQMLAPPTNRARARAYAPGRTPQNVIPIGRQPPPKRDKERKVISRSAALRIAIFKGLDNISEASEIVTAFYDALPAKVREKWDRKDRGLIDQAGQYGIEGADWKLQALWYNWHKVDFQKALTNVAVNNLEDKLYGEAYRAREKLRPRNWSHIG